MSENQSQLQKMLNKLSKADVLCFRSTPKSWWKPIELFTGSLYTHTEIYLGKYFGRHLMVGAGPVFTGFLSKVRVATMPVNRVIDVRRCLGLSENQRERVCRFCMNKLDYAYSYRAFVTHAYRIITGKTNRTRDPFEDEFVCSELIGYAFEAIQRPLADAPFQVTPKIVGETSKLSTICTFTPS